MKKIAMFSDGRCVAYVDGNVREASEQEKKEYLMSMVPATKKGGTLSAIRYNEANKSVEAQYSFAKKNGEVSIKTFAKKLVAQSNDRQSEPVDGVQDESKQKENKTDVPRDKSKAKPETKFERPKEVDNPTEVRKKDYGFGDKGKDLHTEAVPRDKGGDGAGGKSVSFEDEKGEDVTSGNENSYVQKYTPSEKPTPAGNEDNHAVAAEAKKETRVAEIQFAPETLVGIFNREAGKDEEKPNPFAKKDEKDNDDKKDDSKKPNFFDKFKKKDGKDAEKDEEKSEKSEDKGDKEASVDEDVVMKYREAKSQLNEVEEELHKAKAELNAYKIRESRMNKAIEYVLALQSINPEKYAATELFLTKVADSVKRMNIEAIGNAIEELKEIKRASDDARKVNASLRSGDNNVGIESALVIPRTEEGFDHVNKSDLASILMANTKLGKQMTEFADYKPHQKSW